MAPLRNVCFLFVFFISVTYALDIDIRDFGAVGDGKTDASPAFLQAWVVACSSLVPTTIYVPLKRYFLSQALFQGPCVNTMITLRMAGILVSPDYKTMGSIEDWIKFSRVQGVTIFGGFLDGKGSSLWECKAKGQDCPEGASTLRIFGSKDVTIQNVTSINAKLFHVAIHSCDNVTIQGVRIHAPDNSPNTDGIHVQNSKNIRIFDTGIKTGDDCISIGPGAKNLWIQRVACGPGHGISIGSLGKDEEEEGVENIFVKSVVFTGTDNGIRLKSWGRKSNGYVNGVVFTHIVMNNVKNPLLIDQNYCPRNDDCPGQHSGVQISNVTFSGITGTSVSQVAMKFDCSKATPCEGINVKDINITFPGKTTKSFCQNARGVSLGFTFPPCCL